MDIWIIPTTDVWPLVGSAFLIACLGGWVSQEAAKRVFATGGLESCGWRLVLAMALGSGVWSAHMVMVSARSPNFPVGYSMTGAFGIWGLALLFSALTAWAMGLHRMTLPRVGLASMPLATGILATSCLGVESMGLQPGVSWQLTSVALGAAVAWVGAAASLLRVYVTQRRKQRGWWPQAQASCILGATVVLSQHLMISAVNWSDQVASTFHSQLSAATLTALASVGSLVLLITLWLGLLIEAHLRASLRKANGKLERNAHTDLLTGLPNRLAFEDDMASAAQRADEARSKLALLFIVSVRRTTSLRRRWRRVEG